MDKKKIIFLCGMHGGKRDMFVVKRILKDFEIIYFKYDNTLRESIENSAKKLKSFVAGLKLKRGEKVGLIGLSVGGVVADYYLKFLDRSKVDRFVSICSPLHGTYLAALEFLFIGERKGLKQFRKDSGLIKKLNKEKLNGVKAKSFWCWIDPLVPGRSGRGENPEHTLFFLHWIVHFWPPIVYKVKRFFEGHG